MRPMRVVRSWVVLDFGTMLPFNFAPVRTPECWCALKLQLNEGHYIDEGDELRAYPERWAYFLWLPFLHPECRLGQPDLCEITDEIPYQQIFTAVWNSPVHMLDESDVDLVVVGRHLLRFGDCEDWVREAIVTMVVEADSDPAWERFWQRIEVI